MLPRPGTVAVLASALATIPAAAEPADVTCVYLALGCSASAPPLPTVLPGPLYAPAIPSAQPPAAVIEPARRLSTPSSGMDDR